MDTRTPAQRSSIMRAVRTQHSKPELLVRRMLHRLGYRFTLHGKDLPGRPDIVFRKKKAVIFVHGCFWHGHGCKKGQLPRSNLDYWEPKIAANRDRDQRNLKALEALGWRQLSIWQCELTNADQLEKDLRSWLGAPRSGR